MNPESPTTFRAPGLEYHVRWPRTGDEVGTESLCGAPALSGQLLDPPNYIWMYADEARCMACAQLLSEVQRYRDARVAGMREPLGPAQYLASHGNDPR